MTFGNVVVSPEQFKKMNPAEQRLAVALAAEAGKRVERPQRPILPTGSVSLGDCDLGNPAGIDLEKLLDGRLLVQGTSGAGKSWTLRRIMEATHGMVQQIIVDPEGEFSSLAEHFDFPVLDAARLDMAALAIAAGRVRAHRLSVLLDVSQIDREAQMQAVTAFLAALIDAPREHWSPALVVIDEAHLFAPFGGQALAEASIRQAATQTVTDLMSRGRKRGLAGILATQRIAKLAKSVSSEILNFLIGQNTLDIDIRRAAETIGWDASRAFDRLPVLQPGDFVASGPAFTRSAAVIRVGGVVTRHIGARPDNIAPAAVTAEAAKALLALDELMSSTQADSAAREESSLPAGFKAVRSLIRSPGFSVAGQVWDLLSPMAPQGAAIADIADYLDLTPDQVAAGLAILDQYGAIEISETADGRAVRVAPGMLTC